ncbi:hypothetical protein BGW37DRAFT_558371 [Umbelopsis sp. PMI_123]|nr:hypothetical protein BGW37DRAFT_558371 [Umbelopsis sp. PMI_123]
MEQDPYARNHRPHRVATPTLPPEGDPYRIKPSPDGSSRRHKNDRTVPKEPKAKKHTYQELEDFGDDPYAVPGQRSRQQKEAHGRAISYLPYSNHPENHYAPFNEPMYIEDDMASIDQAMNKKSSTLHDSIAMEAVDYLPNDSQSMDQLTNTPKHGSNHLSLSLPSKRKNAKRNCCGISRKVCVYFWFAFIVVVGVVWYFVWPRIPTLYVGGASLNSDPVWSNVSSVYSLQTAWNINFTADNSVNWVPTQIRDMHFLAYDPLSGATFGSADTGHIVLAPRVQTIITIPMNIAYNTTSVTDATFQNLYNACGPQKSGNDSQQILRIAFTVTHYIAGIAWSTSASIMPDGTFACPIS